MRRGKATVTVSAINTLWDLKLRIMEALSVHPRNADVYCLAGGRWKQLESDEATLAGMPSLILQSALALACVPEAQNVQQKLNAVFMRGTF